jgi:endonuclease/exonuclease/phosphatase family metal-dependent hydrolase
MKMKPIIAIILFAAFFRSTVSSQTTVAISKVVIILSFNILHGATTKGDFDSYVIAKVIEVANPYFIAMPEVDFKTNRAKRFDLVTELGWRTNMAPIFARAMSFDIREYVEDVLSKYTFLKSRNIALSYSPASEPRTALEILTIQTSDDTIAFSGIYLDSMKDEKDRLAQIWKLNEIFSLNKYQTILDGDLNAIPESKAISILEKS